MLEAGGQLPDRASKTGVDGIAGSAGRGGMVSFIQNQQGAGAQVAQPIAQGRGVDLIDQQAVRHQETREGRPGIDPEPAFLADTLDVSAVQDFKGQAEPGFQFVLPLQQHLGRAAHHDFPHPPSQQQFGGNQPRLDRLAQTDIVGDEEVDAG